VSPYSDHKAWEILHQFSGSDSMTLPEAEKKLQAVLGRHYQHEDWSGAFKCVMDTENDIAEAQRTLQKHAKTCGQPKLVICFPLA
jgi:hypothetical protein